MKPLIELRSDKVKRVKVAMKRRGVRYGDIARRATAHNPAGVKWWMVWAVLHGRKTSANVEAALVALVPEARALFPRSRQKKSA